MLKAIEKIMGIIKLAKPTNNQPIMSGKVPKKGISKERGEQLIKIFESNQLHHQ